MKVVLAWDLRINTAVLFFVPGFVTSRHCGLALRFFPHLLTGGYAGPRACLASCCVICGPKPQ